jgi:hypothetical protein
MKKLSLLLALLIALPAAAQIGYGTAKRIQYGSSLPLTCDPTTGDVFFKNAAPSLGPYACSATNTWSPLAFSSPSTADNIYINGTQITDANFNDTNPAALSSGANCKWQFSTAIPPNDVSCYFPAASAGATGLVTNVSQTFAGDKTFTGIVTSLGFVSSSANPSLTGQVRLSRPDCIKFRNNANSADVSAICFDTNNNLTLSQLSYLSVSGTVVSSAAFTSGSNTCGIQEAYNSISGTGGVIWVPSGTCDFASAAGVVLCANNITLQGTGSTSTLLRSLNADVIKLCNTVSGGLHEIRVRDIGIAKQAGSVTGNGINIAETASAFENSHNTFERITISNMPEQGFHDGNCSWCSFRDLVMQGNSGRGMEIGTSAGGKGGSSNDSAFTNVEVSTNAFGGMLVWGRADTFHVGHWFANTGGRDLEIRGSNNTFLGGWVEDAVSFPAVLIRRSDPIIYNNKIYGMHFTNVAGNGTGPMISVGQAADAAGSVIGTEIQGATFTCNDAPSPITCVGNAFADISIDASATATLLHGNTYHAAIGTALIDNGVNTMSLNDDIAGATPTTKLFNLVGSGNPSQFNQVQSRSANPSSAGFIRMANVDTIKTRNNANGADLNTVSTDTGDVTQVGDANGVRIGTTAGDAPLKRVLSATASLDFAAVAANVCAGLTITVTGAADGDVVDLGVPNALASTVGLSFSGYVSSGNTVTVLACNSRVAASADPAAATVRAQVTKF